MIAKIMSLNGGLDVLDNINFIRIKSQKYNLLLMQNYAPLIGEIDGSVEFISESETKDYKDIKGYYLNLDNEFKLFIRE